MPDANASNSVFSCLGEEFCWHARNFAGMYGAECVDTVHLLLAAAEVTPVELHGCPGLTTLSVTGAMAELRIGSATGRATELLPQKLTPGAQEFASKVMSYAARTQRAPTLRDVWVALSQEVGNVALVLRKLGVDKDVLYRRLSGS